MEQKIRDLIASLEAEHDFEDEFYLTFIGELNDGDISDWAYNHFDDNIATGTELGQTMLADEIIGKLKQIIGE